MLNRLHLWPVYFLVICSPGSSHIDERIIMVAAGFMNAVLNWFVNIDSVYSVLKLFTGLAIATLMAWKLTVAIVINKAINAPITKTPAPMLMR